MTDIRILGLSAHQDLTWTAGSSGQRPVSTAASIGFSLIAGRGPRAYGRCAAVSAAWGNGDPGQGRSHLTRWTVPLP